MKLKLQFLFLLCGLLPVSFAFSQKTSSDTIPYKIGKYDIKKQEKVFVTAQKLGVDPAIIVKLNKMRNVDQDLVAGQRIKIPVYKKGYVFVPQKIVIHKPVDSYNDNVAYTDDFNNTLPTEFFDPDAEKTRLMIIDATLELNQAMMQGLQASFDTLNQTDNSVANEKDINAMLRKMKRSRDRSLLTPYLEHLRDSLSMEIDVLTKQKEFIESRLNPSPEPLVKTDTVVSGADTIVYATKTFADNRPAETTLASVIVKDDVLTKPKNTKIEVKRNNDRRKKLQDVFALDTVIIYDLPSANKPMKPAPERHARREPVKPKGQAWDTARAINPLQPTAYHWDTARAVKPVDVKRDTTISLKIKIPNSNDSIVIKPIVKTKPLKDTLTVVQKPKEKPKENPQPVADTVVAKNKVPATHRDTIAMVKKEEKTIAKQDTPVTVKNKAVATKDAVAKEKPKEVVSKTETKKELAEQAALAAAAVADSIKKIKAEFFLKRAQKAMAEKNWKNAEEYLQKSIELFPKYFDAWFALAEMDDLYGGSQQRALKEYMTCQSIDSTQNRVYISMGNLYVKMKRKSDAFAVYSHALEMQPRCIPALMARAIILYDWKRYDDAIADYNRVVQIDHSYHYAYKARGQVYLLNRNFKDAIDDFTRFLIFEETDPSAYYYRGVAKIGNNELLDGCLDLSTSASMGYTAAEKAIKKSCE